MKDRKAQRAVPKPEPQTRISKTSQAKQSPAKESLAKESVKGERLDWWESFWFLPATFCRLRLARIGLGILSLIYVSGYLLEATTWFGENGMMSTERLGQLVVANEAGGAAFWRWSLLHWIQSDWGVNLFFASVAISCIALAVGWGGRWVALWLWLGIISIANAGWVLAEVGIIPLSLGLRTFVLTGLGRSGLGRSGLGSKGVGTFESHETSLNRLGIRLNQIHVIGFLLAYSLSVLFNENPIGEGVRRQLISHGLEWLPQQIWLCRLIHGLLITTPMLVIAAFIFLPQWRMAAVIILLINLFLVGLISSDLYFAGAVGLMALSFIDREQEPQTDTVPLPIPQPL